MGQEFQNRSRHRSLNGFRSSRWMATMASVWGFLLPSRSSKPTTDASGSHRSLIRAAPSPLHFLQHHRIRPRTSYGGCVRTVPATKHRLLRRFFPLTPGLASRPLAYHLRASSCQPNEQGNRKNPSRAPRDTATRPRRNIYRGAKLAGGYARNQSTRRRWVAHNARILLDHSCETI